MHDVKQPTVFILCGFVASGKTTYARQLEGQGCSRLSIDEAVFERHGRHGVDYPESDYPQRQATTRALLDHQLKKLLSEGKCVVLDYGFWSKEGRDRYKRLIDDAGGAWRLLYFKADLEVVRERLQHRNQRDDADALFVNERMLKEFLSRWEPPDGEGEEVIEEAAETSSRGR